MITFTEETATLTLYNVDDPTQQLIFTSPMRNLELKGANAVQLLGGVETYQRRYLYMAVLDIVEADQFDNMPIDSRKPSSASNNTTPAVSFVDTVAGIVANLSPDQKKAAGEIVKKHNRGSANVREITDLSIQNAILTELKEVYHV